MRAIQEHEEDEISEEWIEEQLQRNSKRLCIQERELLDIPWSALSKSRQITELHLGYNLIMELTPKKLAAFNHLSELWIFNNQLRSIPESISCITSLRVANFDNNQLRIIPSVMSSLPLLRALSLSGNILDSGSFPGDFRGFPELRTLNLSKNQFYNIPEWIAKLPSLEILHMEDNQLQDLFFSKPINPLLIPMQANEVDSPDSGESQAMSIHWNLEEFYLSNNQLRSLGGDFLAFRNLQVFDVRFNPIVNPPLSVCGQGPDAIRRYIEKSRTRATFAPPNYKSFTLTSTESQDASPSQSHAAAPKQCCIS